MSKLVRKTNLGHCWTKIREWLLMKYFWLIPPCDVILWTDPSTHLQHSFCCAHTGSAFDPTIICPVVLKDALENSEKGTRL